MLFGAIALFAQSDRGTITGTVTDPTGAVVGNAPIVARNIDNGTVTNVASSATGNYTIPSLPSGNYELRVAYAGFKEYIRTGLTVQNAQTMGIDIQLEVGASTESVTVTDAAPLLKTESGELSHVVSIQRMDNLPVLQASTSGSAGIRNPIVVVALIPGSALTPGQTGPTVRINGGVNNSQTMLVEGMDASNSLGQGASQQNQVGVDSVQEFAVQTSNYSAEFGQAGSAIMNITMKSGTNLFHGSAYEYWVHEKLNSGQPLLNAYNAPTVDQSGGNLRRKTRRNDFGFTFGGPVWIPKLYDGRNRTFFFLNWEEYKAGAAVTADAISVPTAKYRAGDFSQALLATNLGTDPNGNVIRPNMIYDPKTRRTVNGSIVTDPFPNNIIPTDRLDPVALKVQALIPNPTNPNAIVNNYNGTYTQERVTRVPSIKIDQVVGSKHKFAFLANRTRTQCDYCAGAEGLPLPITAAIGTDVRAHTERLNWDTTLTPTLLLHWGIGFTQNWLGRPALANGIDATALLGLRGPFTGRGATFPNFTFLPNSSGGSANISSTGALADDVFQQGTAIVSLTWVKNNHTFKYGGELRNQGDYRLDESGVNGNYGFSQAQTALPYIVQSSATAAVGTTGQTIGLPYASFLLGLVNSGNVKPGSRGRVGKKQLGFYAQDTWKITRKLTLDYGLRYDYSTYLKEQYGRMTNLAPNVANAAAGGHPGATQYEATCGCNFANNYKFAFGPRLGLAYQINTKTVLRAGFGVAYTGTPQYNLAGGVVSATNPFGPNSDAGRESMTLAGGLPLTPEQIRWPNFSPSYYPVGASVGTGPASVVDQNSGRPGRSYQYSIGLQREINRNLVVEASFVANRQIWLPGANLVNYNFLDTNRLNSYGLSLNNPLDLTILNSQVTAIGAGRFRNQLPFPGFTGTVAQSLRPFPQFNGGLTPLWAPLGNAWYDSLQVKVTQRLTRGFDFTYAFTYSKEIDTFSSGNFDVQNRQLFKTLSSNSRPLISNFALNYTVPALETNKALSFALRDWTVGGFFQYASALPFTPPVATATPTMNSVAFQTTFMNRVPGENPFTVDLNCHCYDPNTTFVLNPKAWVNPAQGQFGSGTFYGDFRRQRHPFENISLGRVFRLKEKLNLNVRVEMTNIFNRAYYNDPTSTNPLTQQTWLNNSIPRNFNTAAGYGFINNANLNQGTFAVAGGQPRQGQMVARLQF
jgi:hypothetical protein